MMYADLSFAAEYFETRAFVDKWQALTDADRQKLLTTATTQIDTFCLFYDDEELPVYYDATDAPDWLKRACCEQALYLANLGKDPTQTEEVVAMGIASTKGTVFDRDMVANILSVQCRKIIVNNGGEVSPEACGNASGNISFCPVIK
jgi:hypothetical protein